jgi:hypothetical protein
MSRLFLSRDIEDGNGRAGPYTDGLSAVPSFAATRSGAVTTRADAKSSAKVANRFLYYEFCHNGMVNGLLPQRYASGWGQALRFDSNTTAHRTEWKAIAVNSNWSNVLLYNLTDDPSESVPLAGTPIGGGPDGSQGWQALREAKRADPAAISRALTFALGLFQSGEEPGDRCRPPPLSEPSFSAAVVTGIPPRVAPCSRGDTEEETTSARPPTPPISSLTLAPNALFAAQRLLVLRAGGGRRARGEPLLEEQQERHRPLLRLLLLAGRVRLPVQALRPGPIPRAAATTGGPARRCQGHCGGECQAPAPAPPHSTAQRPPPPPPPPRKNALGARVRA